MRSVYSLEVECFRLFEVGFVLGKKRLNLMLLFGKITKKIKINAFHI